MHAMHVNRYVFHSNNRYTPFSLILNVPRNSPGFSTGCTGWVLSKCLFRNSIVFEWPSSSWIVLQVMEHPCCLFWYAETLHNQSFMLSLGLYWTDDSMQEACFYPADKSCEEKRPVKCFGTTAPTTTSKPTTTSSLTTSKPTPTVVPRNESTSTVQPLSKEGPDKSVPNSLQTPNLVLRPRDKINNQGPREFVKLKVIGSVITFDVRVNGHDNVQFKVPYFIQNNLLRLDQATDMTIEETDTILVSSDEVRLEF